MSIGCTCWDVRLLKNGERLHFPGCPCPEAQIERLRAEIARMREEQGTQRTAMVRATAELRHTYGNHAHGYRLDPELVSRAIRLLEEALAPIKDPAL